MERGYSIKRAEQLINSMEDSQGRSLFGTEEKDLLCNYAYHIEAFSKVEALASLLAQARFELQHEYIDPAVAQRVSREIDRVDEIWQAADNYLKTAEMGTEQNYNQIDGIINNRPPCPSVLENLKQHREAAAAQGRDTGQPHKPHQGPER